MNAPAATPIEAGKLAANQAVVRGRIVEVKKTQDSCFTSITLPAPDQYSQPQNIEVRSIRMLGKPQEDVTVRVMLGGFRRSYTDKSGDKQFAINIVLHAIED